MGAHLLPLGQNIDAGERCARIGSHRLEPKMLLVATGVGSFGHVSEHVDQKCSCF